MIIRSLAALTAGVTLLLSFPRHDLWWLAPVGVAGLALACRGVSWWCGALLGGLTGLALFIPLLSWTGLHTGAWPWLLLAAAQAFFVALLGVGLAWTSPLSERWPALMPPVVGVLWVAQEALRDRLPWGGFPWGRLAFSQGDSPLLRLAAVGGAPLVTAAVAVIGGVFAAAWVIVGRWRGTGVIGRWQSAAVVATALVVVGGALFVATARPAGRTVTVAVIQGNVPRLGLDFNAQRRAVLDNHVDATLDLAARVSRGAARAPDLVVWPENSADIDPLINADARAQIDRAAAAIGAPILVGAVLRGPGDRVRNAGIVWSPGTGPGQMYVKRHPVPFAEYVPYRGWVRRVTRKADLVRADFVAGRLPGVLRVGPATIGDVICFEVAYDALVRDTVTGGAQLIVVQTNNATFGYSAEAAQQLAMVRLRAVEHDRPALMASTTGISGFVDSDGTVHDATAINTRAVIVRGVTLGTSRTVATRLGEIPEWVLIGGALVAVAWAGWCRRRITQLAGGVDSASRRAVR